MKKYFFFLIVVMSRLQNFGQDIKVIESNESFNNGRHNALVVTFYSKDKSEVEKEWKSLIKANKNEGSDEKRGEYFFDNVLFKAIGNNTVDVYSKIEVAEKDKTLTLTVCFDLGGAYASSSESGGKMDYFKNLVKDFAIKMAKESINEEMKLAEKALTKLKDKQLDLETDNKNLETEIIKAKEKIELNKKEIETKKTEVVTQEKLLEEIKQKMNSVK